VFLRFTIFSALLKQADIFISLPPTGELTELVFNAHFAFVHVGSPFFIIVA